MRATLHNGRSKNGKGYGEKHNDRKFDLDKADNIDQERTKNNQYINCYKDPSMSFEEVELRFYNEHFGQHLERVNENYIKNRHPERVKTMEEWKRVRQNAPEESILQIGKMEEQCDSKVLVDCYNDYNKWLEGWNREHGRPFTTLDVALHRDEAVDHIQSRRVWHYKDAEGNLRIGQEKALKAAGVELPEPGEKESRRNNRKVTFDRMCREKWLDIIQEHGIDIEREPVPNGRHNREKEEMIRDKHETMLQEASEAEIRRDTATKEVSVLETRKERLEGDCGRLKDELDEIRQDKASLDAIREEVMEQSELITHIDRIEGEPSKLRKGKLIMDENDVEQLKKAAKQNLFLSHKNIDQGKQIDMMQRELDRRNERLNTLAIEKNDLERELKGVKKVVQQFKDFLQAFDLHAKFDRFIEARDKEKQRQNSLNTRIR